MHEGCGSAGIGQSTAAAPRGSPSAALTPGRLPTTGLGTGTGGGGRPGSIPVLPNNAGSTEEERREDFH